MDPQKNEPVVINIIDVLVKFMNFWRLLLTPRNFTNFRWANHERDYDVYDEEFAPFPFRKVYGRVSSRYRYHPLQIYENAIRHFDLTEQLKAVMQSSGNAIFYTNVCNIHSSEEQANYAVDLTRIDQLQTASAAGDYLYGQILHQRLSKSSQNFTEQSAHEAADIARTNYKRGFSRLIDSLDPEDWERLRVEIRNDTIVQEPVNDLPGDRVTLVALSYKGKEVKFASKLNYLNEDGSPKDDEGIVAQTIEEMTSDFIDDFRWSQLVRSCIDLAKKEGTTKMRVWIDRLVMNGYQKEEISRRYKAVDWEEFGLLPYAVCPVVRLYDAEEENFGTEFWRDLETVLGVAGKGLIVDDYMLRQYDIQIYYGKEMYERLGNGLSRIGGNSVYLRATTLALATAVLTDSVLTSARNEDIRTKRAASEWKAWALRTIAEGAYSQNHFCMLAKEEAFRIGFVQFRTISFWESYVCRSRLLTGKSYLDVSRKRARQWITTGLGWDGIVEWVGRMRDSCKIEDRDMIMSFLSYHSKTEMWVATSGHTAAWMTLRMKDARDSTVEHKRSLVLNLSAFSTTKQGHVVGIAEASGLWQNKKVSSNYYVEVPRPDADQTVELTNDGDGPKVTYTYTPILRLSVFALICLFLLAAGTIAMTITGLVFLGRSLGAGVTLVVVFFMLLVLAWFWIWSMWPWIDHHDVGEAVFDNLLKHSLFQSRIKKQYRELRATSYEGLCRAWH